MITHVIHILLAAALDQLFGDPRWLPHPVRFIGAFGQVLEKIFRKILPARLAGIVTLLFMLAATAAAVLLLLYMAGRIHPLAGALLSIIILYTTIAAADLRKHSLDVYEALQGNDLAEARRRVGMIVGRETDQLSKEEVARAAVESVAESMVDGVCAPLFYAFLGGPVLAMVYKAVNTADSMFGYKNEKYEKFGWASARIDDAANFIPARLTAALIPLAAWLLRLKGRSSWHILWRDRKNHASPNSGHSEAAVAGALGVQLGGANTYFGKVVEKPTIGDPDTAIAARHILQANRLMLLTMILLLLFLSALVVAVENFAGL